MALNENFCANKNPLLIVVMVGLPAIIQSACCLLLFSSMIMAQGQNDDKINLI
jgi:hypothetical protein